jgi:cystinosin
MLNVQRQSTVGWSITNVILDFMGGSMSLLQLLLQCWVLNDWSQIAGNPVKFGLGFVSLSFDIIFMVQHFILYSDADADAAQDDDTSHLVSDSSEQADLLRPQAPDEASELEL